MASRTRKKETFSGMGYREVQRLNSQNRRQLTKADQQWLKQNGYRNLGWEQVIRLYQKIEEFLSQGSLDDPTLESLFLEADRIGNKYLTPQEINDFNQKFTEEVNQISEEIDRQFPDTEVEIIDFRPQSERKHQTQHRRRTYRSI